MNQKNYCFWTNFEKVRMNKLTFANVYGRRLTRRPQIVRRKSGLADYTRTGSGKTTLLLLGVSLAEWCDFLFEGYKQDIQMIKTKH